MAVSIHIDRVGIFQPHPHGAAHASPDAKVADQPRCLTRARLIIGRTARKTNRGRALEEQPFGWQIGHDGNAVLTDGDGADQTFVGRFCAGIRAGHDVGLRGEAISGGRLGAVSGFADLKSRHLSGADGYAVIAIGLASITLEGVAVASRRFHDVLI